MKILAVCQYYYPENVTITKICEQLVKMGHEVDVLTAKPNYGYGKILPEYKHVKQENINGVNVFRTKIIARKKSRLSIIFNYLSFWKNSKKWIRKCKKQYDVVYSMSLSPVTILAAGNLYKKMHNVPHVVHCVDLWPESTIITHAVKKNSLIYKILYKWSKKLYSDTDEIMIGSPSFKEYFIKELHINKFEFPFVPQPSLVEDFNNIDKYNFNNNSFNITYCGNLGLIQQIPEIIDLMNLLKDQNINLNVIGMGPLTSYLETAIKEKQMTNVKYFGPMAAKKAAPYLLGSDALLVSLKNNGFVGKTIPNKLMMYLAASKPIIGYIDGDGKDVISSIKGNVASNDLNTLANEIKKLSTLDKTTLNSVGKDNKIYYENNFSLKTISKQIENILFKKTH